MSVNNPMDVRITWKDTAGIRSLTLVALSTHTPTPDNPAHSHTLHYAFPQLDTTDLEKPGDVYMPLTMKQVLELQNTGKYEAVVAMIERWIKG